MQGTIHRLIRGKGFGFIHAEDRQYFFHHSEVRGIEFRHLIVGDVVEFQGVDEPEGRNPRAVEVSVLVKAERPPPREGSPLRSREPAPSSASSAARRGGRGTQTPADGASRPRDFDTAIEDDGFDPGLGFEGDDEFEFDAGPPHGEEAALQAADGNAAPSAPAGETTADRQNGRRGQERAPRGDRRPQRSGRGRVPGKKRSRGSAGPKRPKAVGSTGARGEGVVRSINIARGFGFIETPTGDLFFHRSGVKSDFEALSVGSRVAFVFGEGDRGAKAEDVSVM